MSIRDQIAALVSRRALVPINAVRPIKGNGRRLFLTADAWKALNNPTSAVNLLVGKGFLVAAMERWVVGDRIYGDRRGGKFLKPLDPPPDDIWELRVTEPVVQGRLFVIFAEPNTLVMTGLHTRELLGRKSSLNWQAAMQSGLAEWFNLFPRARPFRAYTIHQYVTENCDDFPVGHT